MWIALLIVVLVLAIFCWTVLMASLFVGDIFKW